MRSWVTHIISNVKNRCIQTRTVHINRNPYKEWINGDLVQVIAQRNRYRKLIKQYPNNKYAQQQYIAHCKQASWLNDQFQRKQRTSKFQFGMNIKWCFIHQCFLFSARSLLTPSLFQSYTTSNTMYWKNKTDCKRLTKTVKHRKELKMIQIDACFAK